MKSSSYKFLAAAGFVLVAVFLSYQIGREPLEGSTEFASYGATKESASNLEPYAAVQKVFNQRCVACHGCTAAPCSLNLQSYQGFSRGASKIQVFNPVRQRHIPTLRLGIDFVMNEDWHKNGFFPVVKKESGFEGPFWKMIALNQPGVPAPKQAADSLDLVCAENDEQFLKFQKKNPGGGMPYGLPPLNSREQETLRSWLGLGAPGPVSLSRTREQWPSNILDLVHQWESFFNARDPKQILVSRYVYEHLFFAHLYVEKDQRFTFRLVRTKDQCSAPDIREIPTRRPNQDPGGDFNYCFKQLRMTIVAKNHVPLLMDQEMFTKINNTFFSEPWETQGVVSYEETVSANPLIAFKDIPSRARYRFLLQNSHFMINNLVKGPVCYGQAAVNVIQEQFYVLFVSPDADSMTNGWGPDQKKFEEEISKTVLMPGQWGSDVKNRNSTEIILDINSEREKYRALRISQKMKIRPNGYTEKDIWDGDGVDDNAILTVIRHNDNAAVFKGAQGDLSKTVFVLDYPLFERIFYNLVTNFDPYGNFSHVLLTRLYMDFIRLESDEIFMSFLPPEAREPIHKSWYQGSFVTEARRKFLIPKFENSPTAITYKTNGLGTKAEFVHRILFNQMNGVQVRGPVDVINWKNPALAAEIKRPLTFAEKEFRKIASIPAEKSFFPSLFPDVSLVLLMGDDKKAEVYTIVKNTGYKNIAWIAGDNSRRNPEEDTLSIYKGVYGTYPNLFFFVKTKDLSRFVETASRLRNAEDYAIFKKSFGVSPKSTYFWNIYDRLNASFKAQDPWNAGVIDLLKYEVHNFDSKK